jgi:dTDP-glucose 4,6-dehydratase
MTFSKNIAVTGGMGFIGSHLVNHLVSKYPNYFILNIDALTYAANLKNITVADSKNYLFERVDITNKNLLISILEKYKINNIIHLAAESHVDNSILSPDEFIQTNINGTFNLLQASRQLIDFQRFHHVSTDEVYGTLGKEGYFFETTPYAPNSPYSASKASSDHLVNAYHHTYKMDTVITNCSNNYGSNQYPEKLIPVIIKSILNKSRIPVYGKGDNIRDWLFVKDHVSAIDLVFHDGNSGNSYNIGGDNEWTNLLLVEKICDLMDNELGQPLGTSKELISFVTDRKGHDFRYAINHDKITNEMDWQPKTSFEDGLKETIQYYIDFFKSK